MSNSKVFINNNIDFYTHNQVSPNEVENFEESFDDIMKDLSKIPKSKLKKNKAPKLKNGYQQGVEIGIMNMEEAKSKANTRTR